MDLKRAMELRHAVRDYEDKPLAQDAVDALTDKIADINFKTGMHFQLIQNEPKAFGGLLGKIGGFHGANNYFALVVPKGDQYQELAGYYGEQLVLLAQTLGLNTCWVYATYRKVKTAVKIDKGEKLLIVITVGYGKTQGNMHVAKEYDQISATPKEQSPEWYSFGVRGAHFAPTARNQQSFQLELVGDHKVRAKAGSGACSKIDLGIVKYHFELGCAPETFEWAK